MLLMPAEQKAILRRRRHLRHHPQIGPQLTGNEGARQSMTTTGPWRLPPMRVSHSIASRVQLSGGKK